MAVVATNGFASSTSGADNFIQDHVVATGNVIWVDSQTGNDANTGSEGQPLATLGQAITNASASNGDIVIIKSGHTETLSSQLTINKAGVKIFGIGNGTSAPAFTVSAAIVGIDVTGAYVELNNLYFPEGITLDNTCRVKLDAAGIRVKNCRFKCGVHDVDSMLLTANAVHADIDSVAMTITADGPNSGIVVQSASTVGLKVTDCSFDGGAFNWDNAAIYSTVDHLNYRYETITLTNEASIKHSGTGNKGVIGNLTAGDGSQVQA